MEGKSSSTASPCSEYAGAQEFNADRPEAHLNLAACLGRERKFDRAEAELKNGTITGPPPSLAQQ
jgi:hypothetical protein